MSGDFLDSNVILYAFDQDDARHEVASQILANALAGDACISFQVVQEVLRVLADKLLASSDHTHSVLNDVLTPLWRVMPSLSLYDRALAIRGRLRYSFYDSLIVAAALEAGCSRLLTEDMQDGQRIEGLTIVNPFAARRPR